MEINNTSEEKLLEVVKKAVNQAFQNHPKTKAALEKKLYSIKELVAFLGCSTARAQQLKNSGKI